MRKKGRLFLFLSAATILIIYAYMVYAACQGSQTCWMTLRNPSGNPVTNCSVVINPINGSNCNQQSNPSCTRSVTCQERGTYTASAPSGCHIDGVSPNNINILTCSYDDCSACCTSGTSYYWNLGGESPGAGACCGDDANEYYQPPDVGTQELCCNNNRDCAINGVCISRGSSTGNYCCYGTSTVDPNPLSCSTYSNGATCYYNGVNQCNRTIGWKCIYNTKTCNITTQCIGTCGAEGCYYTNGGGYDYGALPSNETACSDTHDNDCDGKTDMLDTDCWECSSGPCCDVANHQFRPIGYVCDGADVCQDQFTLCDYKTCNAVGNCVNFGGCSACSGKTTGDCGVATGFCTSNQCEFTDDVSKCSDCDDECDPGFMCSLITTSPCCYRHSTCLSIANNPSRPSGQEPSDPAQCLCHTLFQDPNCVINMTG
jgi:hypothetical protein